MTAYFLRRLLLVPVTFVVITFLVYAIQRLTPGGPIEQARLKMLSAASEGGRGGRASPTGETDLPPAAMKQLERYYKLDRSIPVGYLIWLGVRPDADKEGRLSGILEGDFGTSYRYSEPVLSTITSRFSISSV